MSLLKRKKSGTTGYSRRYISSNHFLGIFQLSWFTKGTIVSAGKNTVYHLTHIGSYVKHQS